MNKFISYATAFLVFVLGIGSFILSYNALYGVALSNGLSQNLSFIWPLLVDFALIVFSLAVVQSNLNNEPAAWRWAMVALYTIATIAFNVYHAPANLAAQIVAVVAPVSLFLSFETLMSMLKTGVKKNAVVLSLAQITAKLGELEAVYQGQKDRLESELDSIKRDRLAEIETQTQARQTELDALTTIRQNDLDKVGQELETVYGQIAQAKAQLSDILGQIDTQKDGQKDRQIPIVIIGEGLDLPKMKPAERQKYLPQLLNGGVNKDTILDIFGISAKTLDRDIKECNGAIMAPEEIPGTIARNGNGKAGK